MKNKKGFTLIELLAVIVILGLLMAIAIPSVTKYITQSRKKTLVSTIGNYMSALANDVNDLTYTFTEENTIYAVPIDCISLERGGTDPFGAWHQASKAYFAYVLVQYDDETSSYMYGYTFKDSAGYGLYPTSSNKLNNSGNQIATGLDLKKPKTGLVNELTPLKNWKNSGFKVNATTLLVVLNSTSEGEVGDGINTCTLTQKGANYDEVQSENVFDALPDDALSKKIKNGESIIKAKPTLTSPSNKNSDAHGLYMSNATNSGKPTYYYRGNVTNNYVSFAGFMWRIIRINEDGTVRLILNERIGTAGYKFNSSTNNIEYMYYSKSNTAKPALESWYETNLSVYDTYIAKGTFCEQAKVKIKSTYTSGNADMVVYSDYTPNFRCETDGNGHGILKLKVGLITYDEVIYAGAYNGVENIEQYLSDGSYSMWTMSANGVSNGIATAWRVGANGNPGTYGVSGAISLRPVINLNKNVIIEKGTGTEGDPYIVQTN